MGHKEEYDMKYKFTQAFIILGILSVVLSCGHRNNTAAENDTASGSEIPAETVVPSDSTDSISEYLSADLKGLRIKGAVSGRSRIRHNAEIVYPEITAELAFDSLGNLVNAIRNLKIERDSTGYNTGYILQESDGTQWHLTYTEYNESGYPVAGEIEEEGPQGSAYTLITYSDYGYDKKGNWTTRLVAIRREFTDPETGDKYVTKESWREACNYTYCR